MMLPTLGHWAAATDESHQAPHPGDSEPVHVNHIETRFLKLILHSLLSGLALLALSPTTVAGQTADELQRKARAALEKGDAKTALALAAKAIELDAKNSDSFLLRGTAHEALRQHKEAVADFDRAIQLDPKNAEAYNRRGSEQFKLGRIKESIADFDRFLQIRPDQAPGHWKRGISYYYAGRFDDGRKQFEGYEKVDTNDVENAVWHFLCVARMSGIDKARAGLLKIGKDKRVPMMQVYELFAGKLKPEDVLAAARADSPPAELLNRQLFYAQLYLGLYHEVAGEKKQALEHMNQAVEHKIGHYMWDVAKVHQGILQKAPEK
jgi:lipoprotein NlpI